MKKTIYSSILLITFCFFLFPTMISASIENDELQLNSEAAILIDAQSGQVIYEKNSKERLSPASITKIATSIYAIENGNLDELVTVSENARNVDGTVVYLEVGEQVPLLKLVQGLLINSGNDAGVAIAEHLSGSVDEYIIDFNQYLQEQIGVENTYFTNPHGLYDPEHLTTAEDMAKITQYALNNEVFRDIFKTKELPWDGETWDTTLINHHVMVRDESYEGITGGKNGFVTESGFTLVTTAERENLSLIAVTLKSKSDDQTYADTSALLDYGFQHFETDKIITNEQFEDNQGNIFVTNQDISYTKKIGESVETEISPSGELVIEGEDGRELQRQNLVKLKSKENDEQMKSKVVASPIAGDEIKAETHLRFIVPLALVITFFISGIFFINVRRL
ncbi:MULTISPECIES: D-alanyl-D-alanine carboxypeptidase family protein [Metabacillus]|nr:MULTISPECIES: D-alanyl-D-alanine carboxypeptidase family protein [Metabacillus]QNF26952.1 D-alanyl-D-alanine carboxypeptidase [Metabacillus sp. KUDC1714]